MRNCITSLLTEHELAFHIFHDFLGRKNKRLDFGEWLLRLKDARRIAVAEYLVVVLAGVYQDDLEVEDGLIDGSALSLLSDAELACAVYLALLVDRGDTH